MRKKAKQERNRIEKWNTALETLTDRENDDCVQYPMDEDDGYTYDHHQSSRQVQYPMETIMISESVRRTNTTE